jgi:uncharacterized protein
MHLLKYLYLFLGTLSLGLGIIGLFIPLLPTTPLLLLAAALYMRSSPKLYNWLLSRKYIGKYIRDFRENKAIPKKTKIVTISLIWMTILYCVICVVSNIWIRISLIIIAIATTIHILSFKNSDTTS